MIESGFSRNHFQYPARHLGFQIPHYWVQSIFHESLGLHNWPVSMDFRIFNPWRDFIMSYCWGGWGGFFHVFSFLTQGASCHPLHKKWLVIDLRRDFIRIQFGDGDFNLNCYLFMMSCSRVWDDFQTRFWNVFMILLFSFTSSISLLEECSNTWTLNVYWW